MLPITTLTAALLGLCQFWLTLQVIKLRRRHHVSIGDQSHKDLALAIRAHANFTEYVPISLILLGLAELNGGHPLALAGFAVLMLAGRLLHAWAFLHDRELSWPRVRGMQFTLVTLASLAVYDAGLALAQGWRWFVA